MTIKIMNKSKNENPAYQREGDSGMDIRANITKGTMKLIPRRTVTVPTGIYMEIPKGYEVQVRPRSGLASKYGVTVLNAPGTIDCNYTGEIKIILINHGPDTLEIENGMRIAQLVVAKVETATLEKTEKLTKTNRGDKGLGSTGTK